MLYTGDGIYCRFCSHEGATVCWKCEEILKDVPEKLYKIIRDLTPDELTDLEAYLEKFNKKD